MSKLFLISLILVVLGHAKIRAVDPLVISDTLTIESYCGDVTVVTPNTTKVISVVQETCNSSGGRMDTDWNVITDLSYNIDNSLYVKTAYTGVFKVDLSSYEINHLRRGKLPIIPFLEFEVKPAILRYYRINQELPRDWDELAAGFNFVFLEDIKNYGFKSFNVTKKGEKLILTVDEYVIEID